MYSKPNVTRFGTFRELTQLGCTGNSDLVLPGAVGSVPEIAPGADGVLTTKICFAGVSGM